MTITELKSKYENDLAECNKQLTIEFDNYRQEPTIDGRDAIRMLQGQIGAYECIVEQLSKMV